VHARELARQVPSELPAGVRRVVITVGSGMALAGLLRGLATTVPILGVRVSEKPVDELLDRRAPADWRARVRFVQAPERYDALLQDVTHHGIPLDSQYEAKALRFVEEGDLFWIIARRYDGR
jgi:1-aminocyclopropane-1-carboxylate deaminase/D-cysteine desulfhydrase-like pyridoxal-dependent ACC family enzyme